MRGIGGRRGRGRHPHRTLSRIVALRWFVWVSRAVEESVAGAGF
jgi:hypothetical protein